MSSGPVDGSSDVYPTWNIKIRFGIFWALRWMRLVLSSLTVVDGRQIIQMRYSSVVMEQYRQMAESLAERVDLDTLLPCELGAATIECGHEFIAQFGHVSTSSHVW